MKIGSYNELSRVLEKYNFKIKKKFGQNFLVDPNTLTNIVEKANIDKDTLVIEIGPGVGALSQYILDKCGYLLAYEIDDSLIEILDETLSEYNNFEIINEDFLKADVNKKLKKHNYEKIIVVANLPYYITTPIITKILEENIKVDYMVMMMQKEVAERLAAVKRTKDYNSLSVFIQYFCDVKHLMNVSRNVFVPKPNVDSAVIKLSINKKYKVDKEKLFFDLVRSSFQFRRKTLNNNLKKFDNDKLKKVFKKLNLNLSQRAEELSLEDFVNVANELNKL